MTLSHSYVKTMVLLVHSGLLILIRDNMPAYKTEPIYFKISVLFNQ